MAMLPWTDIVSLPPAEKTHLWVEIDREVIKKLEEIVQEEETENGTFDEFLWIIQRSYVGRVISDLTNS